MKSYIKELNDEQKKAALQTEGPVLILAGAGSGKTKTIISRTLHILETKNVNSNEILVMTFTNKAAREMEERGQSMLIGKDMPEFTTFHSWCVRFIRAMDFEVLAGVGINKFFSIADQKEQEKIIDIVKYDIFENEEEAKEFKTSDFMLTLGNFQNNSVRFDTVENAYDDIFNLVRENKVNVYYPTFLNEIAILNLAKIYVNYKSELRKSNSIDFEDLINISIYILERYSNIREYVKSKYKYLMVDEFQDTNGTQYKLMKLILNKQNNICVVGDDSQSIYGWRGAVIGYILNFHLDFKNCLTVNLSKNYRSKQKIVKHANDLLKHSKQRHEKKCDLIANDSESGRVGAFRVCSEYEEADFIAKAILTQMRRGVNPGDIAILYRSFFVARNIEEALIKNRIPYNIHKGKTILERVIARALVAYLKALHNKENSIAFSILFEDSGLITKQRASNFYMSIEEDQNMYTFLNNRDYEKIPRITKKVVKNLNEFTKEFNDFLEMDFEDFKSVFTRDNFIQRLVSEDLDNEKKQEKAASNLGVLEVLYQIIKSHNSMESLIETLSLEGKKEDCEDGMVNMMTIHASKGLEFESVFLIGLSEGIFPSEKTKDMEEERRLFYVAITRAKDSLVITSPIYNGKDPKEKKESRFIKESNIDIKNTCKKKSVKFF